MSGVGVVVPCYNYGRFLRDCVSSALGQDGVDVSVLVLDDASDDDTAEVAEALCAEDPRVEYRRHRTNHGHIATYNEGLAWADRDYTVLLSADDLLAPGALSRAVGLMDRHPEVGLVYGRSVRFTSAGPPPAARSGSGAAAVRVRDGAEWIRRRCREGRSSIASPEAVVRTSVQHRVGGYRPELPHTADLEMWLRIAAHASVGTVNADQAYYRVHPRSMSLDIRRDDGQLKQLRERKAAFDLLFDEHGPRIPAAGELRRTVDRRFAREALWLACRALDGETPDPAAVSELVDFAFSVYPAASTREYASLMWRMRLGEGGSRALRPYLDAALLRRPRAWVRWQWRKHRVR